MAAPGVTKALSGYEDLGALLAMMTGDEKHDPAAWSTLDVCWVLYDGVLAISPETRASPERDRVLVSKGHGPQAYFAVLAAKGYFPVEWLGRFGQFEAELGHHPDRRLVPGVEISSGSLGHGLAIAVGVTLALRATARPSARSPRVVCLLGDAELDEGSNFEAMQLAGRLGLSSLTAIVIDNDSATHGWPGGIERRFELEGWQWTRVDGRDHDQLRSALGSAVGDDGDRASGPLRAPKLVVAEVEPKSSVA